MTKNVPGRSEGSNLLANRFTRPDSHSTENTELLMWPFLSVSRKRSTSSVQTTRGAGSRSSGLGVIGRRIPDRGPRCHSNLIAALQPVGLEVFGHAAEHRRHGHLGW